MVAQPRDQFGIALRKPVAVELDVVLEPRAQVAAELQRPAIDLELMAADAGRAPGGVGHDVFQFGQQKFQHMPPRRQRIRNAEHELHMQRPLDQAAIGQVALAL